MRTIFALLLTGMLAISTGLAQTPAPAAVQTVVATPPALPPGTPTSANPISSVLQELKTANEETLKKQAATLQQLDEIQKAVEQLKIYSKRG